MYECVLCHLHLRILLHTSTTQHPININSTDRVIPTETILGRVDKIFCFGILHEPSPPFSVVHSSAVVRERQACERLILLAVEPVAVVRNWQRCRVPAFSERIVVVAFEHVVLVCRHDTHASQMIGQEITNLGVVAGCCHDPAAAEPGIFQSNCIGMLLIYQRTQIVQAVLSDVRHRKFRTVCQVRIFRDNRMLSTSNNILYST